jgi:hypothetical protein
LLLDLFVQLFQVLYGTFTHFEPHLFQPEFLVQFFQGVAV